MRDRNICIVTFRPMLHCNMCNWMQDKNNIVTNHIIKAIPDKYSLTLLMVHRGVLITYVPKSNINKQTYSRITQRVIFKIRKFPSSVYIKTFDLKWHLKVK